MGGTQRIEIRSTIQDARAEVERRWLETLGFPVSDVEIEDVYTIDSDSENLEEIAAKLTNPVTEEASINRPYIPDEFSWALEVGFLPGVTDNVGNTAKETTQDLTSGQFYSSRLFFLKGDLDRKTINAIAGSLANPVIQRVSLKSAQEYRKQGGMKIVVPRVDLHESPRADEVPILAMNDEELEVLGKRGILNHDGTRRGPLALGLDYMHAITDYFGIEGRNTTDAELEMLAQTWSEHCKHTIFNDPMDEIEEGIFSRYIKGATEKIIADREAAGLPPLCVSVFKDNSGAIIFDDEYLITDKVETHNSPSALDPFGGAITGIVGVNRDTIGFGLGAKPVVNRYGFCFSPPDLETRLFRDSDMEREMPSSRAIMEGVIEGVNAGGNTSGIPTNQGFMFFDERYRGKPLVFVGTVGLIPKESAGRPSHEKKAQPGDYVVMVGGRVGLDGIHGATFSSEALDSGSPATAVQIGDPITQKKMSDALLRDARDLGLYNSITDNGAGGLSCSVAEMAEESGGFYVQLEKVPVKYPGMSPWQIWISESQERMTLSVPPDKWDEFRMLMERRGVEATVIGKFTDNGRAMVDSDNQRVVDLDMDFLHNGLPKRHLETRYTRPVHDEPQFKLGDLTEALHSMLARPNIASFEFVSAQYDHEVQGGSVLKPLQGSGRVNADATVTRPRLDSRKGVVLSHGINPGYSDIDTYHMAAAAIDTAVRNTVAAGASLDKIAILDNFCWSSSDDPERLGQLKEAARACFDTAVAYGTPFISGKDSMYNDFKGFDEEGNPIKISVPPTLLISSLGIIEESRKSVSLDAKFEGDLVYVLGETHDELGGSEFYRMEGERRGEEFIGNSVPVVDAERNMETYRGLADAIDEELVASAQSVHRGGLAVSLSKAAMGGRLGMDVSLDNLPGTWTREDYALFSESQGRVVVTINPDNRERFEEVMGTRAYKIGKVTGSDFRIGVREHSVCTTIENMLESYKGVFEGL